MMAAVARFRALIRSNYGVETADLEPAFLADILERIRAKRGDDEQVAMKEAEELFARLEEIGFEYR